MNILKQIISFKKQEVEVRKILVPEKELEKSILFKRKSPSKGFINKDADVKKVTKAYTKFGASGISVLTDSHFFGGSTEDLVKARVNNIPILRKDFIIDPYQLLVSKALGADVILLIASCLSPSRVKELSAVAKELGMEILLEIHEEKELGHICNDIDMVGINNRDLKTFKVDISRAIKLSRSVPTDKLKIAESGISEIETIHHFRQAGYRGFLMGETFMKERDPGKAFSNFAKLF